MIAHRLIEDARALGCSIEIEDGALVVEADCDPPPELLASLRQHKADILAALSGHAAHPTKWTEVRVAERPDDTTAGSTGVARDHAPAEHEQDAAAYVAYLRVRGVRLEAAGNGIVASAPDGTVSLEEWRRLREDDDVMALLNTEAPSAVYRSPDASSWWRDIFEERAAIREFNGQRSRAEAEALAWSELETRWHVDRAIAGGVRT
jgi:hypothetical protein